MRKTIILGMLLLLLAACATQQRVNAPPLSEPSLSDVLENTTEPMNQTTEIMNETIETIPEVIPETKTQTTPETQETTNETTQTETQTTNAAEPGNIFSDYLKTYSTQKGYMYILNGKEYTVRGPVYKVILDQFVELQNVKLDNGTEERFYYYDTVYLDRQTETAIAYCEGHDKHVKDKCYDGLIGKKLTVDYKEYNGILPHDWLGTFLNATPTETIKNRYLVNNKQTTKVVVKQDETTFDLYVDEITGLPLRVDIITPSKTTKYEYLKLVANNVKLADVTASS